MEEVGKRTSSAERKCLPVLTTSAGETWGMNVTTGWVGFCPVSRFLHVMDGYREN